MIDLHDRSEWVNVYSGTILPGLSLTKSSSSSSSSSSSTVTKIITRR